jgi:hypothetical protein
VASAPHFGLDWFLLALLLWAMSFVPLERLAPLRREQRVLWREWTTDLGWFFTSHVGVQTGGGCESQLCRPPAVARPPVRDGLGAATWPRTYGLDDDAAPAGLLAQLAWPLRAAGRAGHTR